MSTDKQLSDGNIAVIYMKCFGFGLTPGPIVFNFARAVIEADRKLAASAPEPQWRPIETAPRDRMLLLYDAAEDIRVIGFYGKHNHVPLYGWVRQVELYGEEVDGFEATHWMPLPPPPNPENPHD